MSYFKYTCGHTRQMTETEEDGYAIYCEHGIVEIRDKCPLCLTKKDKMEITNRVNNAMDRLFKEATP